MKTIPILIIATLCMACRTQITTNYKLVTKHRNYYTDQIAIIGDSIIFSEKDRKGKPKASYILQYRDTQVISTNTVFRKNYKSKLNTFEYAR